jgi:hypothetical protein
MSKKLLFGIGLLLVLAGLGIAYTMYNKPHENIRKASASHHLQATELMAAYEADEMDANDDYLGKIIEVSGTVSDAATDANGLTTVTLASGNPIGGIVCELDIHTSHPRKSFSLGESVTMKGKCTGYLMDVVLVRCVEIQ